MNGAVFWLVFGSVVASPFHPGKIGPMTADQCRAAVVAIGSGDCRRAVGAMTCSADGRAGTVYVCPIFEGEISVPLGSR